MAYFRKWFLGLIRGLGSVVFFIFTVSISPLLIVLYLLCWTRAKLTALVYSKTQHKFLTGEDAMSGMDTNCGNCIINTAIFTTDRLSVDTMKDLVLRKVIQAKNAKKKLLFPKFTHFITLRAGYLMWCSDNVFNIDDHIRSYHCQPPRDEVELKNQIALLCNDPLPQSKSGWEVVIIPLEKQSNTSTLTNQSADGPQTCVLIRVHHAIADGLSLVRLIIEELADNCEDFKQMLKQMISKLQPQSKNVFIVLMVNLARFLYAFVFAPAIQCRQVVIKDRNLVHGPKLSGRKIFEWTSDIQLSTIKDIKNATSTTVNDVIMSCLAGALRRYFIHQKDSPPDFLHSVIPVNLQGPDEPIGMINNLSFVFAHLPTGDMDCLQRLKATKAIMDELKRSPDIIANRWFIRHCFNVIPYGIMKWFIDMSRVSVIFSNVPGPFHKISIQSHRIDAIVPFLPHRSTIGIGVCVLSYSGKITVSISVDTAVIGSRPDVRMLLNGFIEEMQQLYSTVKV